MLSLDVISTKCLPADKVVNLLTAYGKHDTDTILKFSIAKDAFSCIINGLICI